MSYEWFREWLLSYSKKAPGVTMHFARRGNNYYAWASTGEKFRGNAIAKSIEVMWASGHRAIIQSANA